MISFLSSGGAICTPLYAMVVSPSQDQASNRDAVVPATASCESGILSDFFYPQFCGRTICGLAILSAGFWRTFQSAFLSAVFRHEWKRLFCGSNPLFTGGASLNTPFTYRKEVFHATA